MSSGSETGRDYASCPALSEASLPVDLPLARGHPVAHAKFGEDVRWIFGVVAQFAADGAYGGAHGPHVCVAVRAPDPPQQVIVGQHPSRVHG